MNIHLRESRAHMRHWMKHGSVILLQNPTDGDGVERLNCQQAELLRLYFSIRMKQFSLTILTAERLSSISTFMVCLKCLNHAIAVKRPNERPIMRPKASTKLHNYIQFGFTVLTLLCRCNQGHA